MAFYILTVRYISTTDCPFLPTVAKWENPYISLIFFYCSKSENRVLSSKNQHTQLPSHRKTSTEQMHTWQDPRDWPASASWSTMCLEKLHIYTVYVCIYGFYIIVRHVECPFTTVKINYLFGTIKVFGVLMLMPIPPLNPATLLLRWAHFQTGIAKKKV